MCCRLDSLCRLLGVALTKMVGLVKYKHCTDLVTNNFAEVALVAPVWLLTEVKKGHTFNDATTRLNLNG